MAIVGDLVRPGDSLRDSLADIAWLTGFGGTSGTVVIGPDVRSFITDFRYTTLAAETVPESFEIVDATADIVKEVAATLSGRVGIDPAKTSVETHGKLLEAAGEGVEIRAVDGLLDRPAPRQGPGRGRSDRRRRRPHRRGLRAGSRSAAWPARPSARSRSAAEQRMRELGAEEPSFPTIVAAGANGASPHAVPGEHVIAAGEYVTVDMGAIVDGYCSDCTRTLVEGEPDPAQRQVYELVLKAQLAALDAIRAGAHGRAVDAVSREPIAEAGYGERYGHGLGHGVGIEVHEPPRLSKRSEDTLLVGDVVTVEPGIYVPGEFGIRIEDLVVVTEDGCRNLSSRPK